MANLNIFFKKYKKEIFIVFGLLLITLGLWRVFFQKEKNDIAFYHWKTNLNLSQDEEAILTKNMKTPLYLHFMDLVWDEERQFPVPMAQLRVTRPIVADLPIVPVVFITNEVFEKLPLEQVENIADRVIDRLDNKLTELGAANSTIQGIQIDCDWTLNTKDKYFAFLQYLNSTANTPISATIRLHQVKFFEKTGVPPVKKGMLMFYNMGDLSNENTQNSILDLAVAESYMVNFDKYPLSLDVALPLFSWGVVRRDGRVVHLLSGLKPDDLNDELQYQKQENGTYKVLESAYLKSYYCYEGDEIRLESATTEQLKAATKLLNKHLKREQRTVCFYHLDNEILKQYPPDVLAELVHLLE
jgi:hypothetical protein